MGPLLSHPSNKRGERRTSVKIYIIKAKPILCIGGEITEVQDSNSELLMESKQPINNRMDIFNMLLGVIFILVSLIIFISQFGDKAYKNEKLTIGDVKLFCAGIFALLGGVYLLIGSF